jgi:hypothetical protein
MAESFQDEFTRALKLTKSGDTHAAMDLYSKILFENPKFTPVWNQRGYTLLELGHPFDAILNFDRAVELSPDTPEGYINRGAAYHAAEYFEEALKNYKYAVKLNPLMPETHNNVGNTLARLNRIEEALEAYKKAVKVDPKYANGHFGMSMCLLKLGQFEEGWREFEWRWKNGQLPSRGLKCPKWYGDPCMSKNDILLVYGEQGMGDVLQFCRLAPLAKSLWRGKIYIEVVHPLTRVMNTLKGIDGVVTLGEKLPDNIAAAIPMMSLPHLLGIKHIEDIPADVPYLYGDPYRTKVWRDWTKQLPPGMLVGVCWAGMRRDSPAMASIDFRRSMSLDQFGPMAKIPGISWVSLQLGTPREQVKKPPVGMNIGDWGDYLYDFFDTAALISALDLVITVDTSVAHMAGALGKPVWVLSRYDACWRWMMNRDDSPWYPSMRLFTQEKPHDWSAPLERMEQKLREFRKNWEPKQEAA